MTLCVSRSVGKVSNLPHTVLCQEVFGTALAANSQGEGCAGWRRFNLGGPANSQDTTWGLHSHTSTGAGGCCTRGRKLQMGGELQKGYRGSNTVQHGWVAKAPPCTTCAQGCAATRCAAYAALLCLVREPLVPSLYIGPAQVNRQGFFL
jgi:hypothetical protein